MSQQNHPVQAANQCKVTLAQADITTLNIDTIVNAANGKLQRGGGVCGSIFRAAGPGLEIACAAINGCATGDAVPTEPFDMRNLKAIVHAVGPRVTGPLTDVHRTQLGSSYTRSLDVAVQHGLTSIVCFTSYMRQHLFFIGLSMHLYGHLRLSKQ